MTDAVASAVPTPVAPGSDLTHRVGQLLGQDDWSVFDVTGTALNGLKRGRAVGDVLAWMTTLGPGHGAMTDRDGNGLGWTLSGPQGVQNPEEALVLLDALVARGLDVNAEKAPGLSMIERANECDLWGAMTLRLLDLGARPDVPLAFGNGLMHRAVEGDPSLIPALVQRQVPLNVRNQSGDSPLMLAVKDHPEAIGPLLDAGVERDQPDRDGRSPLMVAIQAGRLDLVTVLLAAGANPNHRDNVGASPLMAAVGHAPLFESQPMPRVAMARCLIEAGSDVSARNARDDTVAALAAGARKLDLDLLDLLAQAGADMEHRSRDGHSARSRLERRAERAQEITPAQVAVLADTAALRHTLATLPSRTGMESASSPLTRPRTRL